MQFSSNFSGFRDGRILYSLRGTWDPKYRMHENTNSPNFEHVWGRGARRAKGAAKASCGETVVQKGVFGESVSSLPPQGFQDISGVLRANLKGAEQKRTLQKHPFGQPFLRTTPSPLLWRTLNVSTNRNAWSMILIPLEYSDVMHMKSLRRSIPPEFSDVMIA